MLCIGNSNSYVCLLSSTLITLIAPVVAVVRAKE